MKSIEKIRTYGRPAIANAVSQIVNDVVYNSNIKPEEKGLWEKANKTLGLLNLFYFKHDYIESKWEEEEKCRTHYAKMLNEDHFKEFFVNLVKTGFLNVIKNYDSKTEIEIEKFAKLIMQILVLRLVHIMKCF